MIEAWKPVPGYEDRYEVSCRGRVRSLRNAMTTHSEEGLLCIHFKFGYPKALLYKNRKIKWFFVHRLVWMAHVGPIPDEFVVNHIDHNKANPCLENLEIITQEENVQKAMRVVGHSTSGQKYKQTIAARRAKRISA